ncbi:MAG: helix-turn-helix transcriptional regulator [Sphingomonadaceae bacterium]|nr:helix-turn-helix transcriptional regulator [Sphingomonadaceae bacterium]
MSPNEYHHAGLRDIHKDCLRLVAQHYSSKEIARKLGISKHTVDQRLQHATQKLGAASRFDAARRFHEAEARLGQPIPYDRMTYDAADMSFDTAGATQRVSGGEQDPLPDGNVSRLQDAPKAFSLGDPSTLEAFLIPSVSTGKASPPSLGPRAKVLLVVGVAAISLLAFGAAVAALEVLSRI